MGEVVRKGAATEVIVDHARKARVNATTRGGRVNELATPRLDDVLAIYDLVDGRLKDSRTALVPLIAAEEVADENADGVVGASSDEIWNAIGRPANDPGYSLLFPGGITAYVDSRTEEEPDLIELLVELLGLPILLQLTAEQKAEWQRRLTETIEPLRTAVNARSEMTRRIKLYERVLRALGKIIQMRLVSLKRDFKGEGMTETQIHAIIPDASSPRSSTGSGRAPAEPTEPPPDA